MLMMMAGGDVVLLELDTCTSVINILHMPHKGGIFSDMQNCKLEKKSYSSEWGVCTAIEFYLLFQLFTFLPYGFLLGL